MGSVVVTGLGVVSPIGNDVSHFEEALFKGQTGANRIKHFDPGELPTKIAMEVKNFNPEFHDIKISYALDAAMQAMEESFGSDLSSVPNEARLSIGIGLELFSVKDLIALKNKTASKKELNSLTFLNTPSDICSHLISQKYNFHQSPLIHISACAASSDAIGSGYLQIKRNKAKVILAGGTDSMINPMGVAGFCRIDAMSKKNDRPSEASRPFDRDRDGFVLGEGAAFLVLEDEEHAKNRGVKILARISGYGNSLDAYSISSPQPDGEGAISSMSRALG